MADEKLSIEELQAKQEELQEKHDRAQASFHGARTKYAKAKEALVAFNTKYGRLLKQLVIDQAEEAAAEEPETVEVPVVEDPAGDGPFEDPVDTSADDTAEE